ncbi:MAG TPA: choice-of-anchor D domain-containing protein, partial [Candidatus Kapabacteria bacterium]|nr:choice-of-anchor D domain-containing protein [Candidatus Kapabacteria bacterium]
IHIEFCPIDTFAVSTVDTIMSNAPESPNLLTLLGSGKIGVLSLPPQLDFGLVHLGDCKDSGFYATNTGNDSLLVTSASIIGPNNFTLISPPTPFVLQADSSVFVTIRYCATDTGAAQAFLGTTTDIPDSQTVILRGHSGMGILSIPNSINFDSVPTGGCADTSVFVTNIGTDMLFLTSPSNLLPPFSYLGPTPLTLAPGAGDSVKFQFCPTDTIAYQENTRFDTTRTGVSPTFTLLGNGTEGALATSGAINLGCIMKGDTTVRVTIRNTGTAPLDSLTATVIPNSVASIVHYPPSTLHPGDWNSVVLIIPASNYGAISGMLSIVWRGGSPITLPITGNVTTPPKITTLAMPVMFDSTNVGDTSTTNCIRITNFSCIPIPIDSATILGGLAGEFEIVSNSAKPSLADSAIGMICIRYIPRRIGRDSARIAVISAGDTIPVTWLYGTGKGNAIGIMLAVDTVAGRPGEIVKVPVRTLNDITSAAITSLTFRVTFNPMQLDLKSPVAPITLGIIPAHPLSTTATYSVKTYSIGDKEITATYSSPLTGTPIVAELPFEILEPSANTASIHLLNASFGTSPATLSTASDGLIQIEQCDTNSRVVFSAAPIAVAQNNPNPFSRVTAVTVDVRTAGHLTLEVYNALGMKVMVPFDADVVLGTQTIAIDASALPSGAYRYITTWTGAASPVRIEKTMVVLGE